jgi:predicted alpha/beta-fold hydrolase
LNARAKKRLRLAAFALALLVVGWLGSASFVAWKLTHRRFARGPETAPEDLRAIVHDVRLATGDHEDLGAWWIEGAPQKPVVILFHGLGGCRTVLASRIRML